MASLKTTGRNAGRLNFHLQVAHPSGILGYPSDKFDFVPRVFEVKDLVDNLSFCDPRVGFFLIRLPNASANYARQPVVCKQPLRFLLDPMFPDPSPHKSRACK